jgi:hypothetical protein
MSKEYVSTLGIISQWIGALGSMFSKTKRWSFSATTFEGTSCLISLQKIQSSIEIQYTKEP